MTTTKNLLTRATPLPCIRPKQPTTPLKPSLASFQPILPDIIPSSVPSKPQHKKRVRFALKLDPVEEQASETPPPEQKPVKPEPCRETGPLLGAYVEYLEERENFKFNLSPSDHRPTTPVPEFDTSAAFTHIYQMQNKTPKYFINSRGALTPPNQLPRIAQQINTTKKLVRKPSSPVFDSPIKRRMNTPMPPQPLQGRRVVQHPTITRLTCHPGSPAGSKRSDLPLPIIRSPHPTEKVIRADQPLGSKLVNEYLHTKKMTEIIMNPLPGSTNQVNYICGHSVLPTLRKTSATTCRTPVNHEAFFYQNHHHDHIQPIIHSTH